MFGTYVKDSLKALPWLILLPIGAFILYIITIDPKNFNALFIVIGEKSFGVYIWEENGRDCMILSVIIAIIIHALCVIIIPAALGGANAASKKMQFYMGFFITLLFMVILPIVYTIGFGLDAAAFGVLIALHAVAFPVSFITGALFVTPAYARAFWFTYRK
ncbi:MAG: hypothetical protein LBP19_08170 [Treponema sp.]|jgi:hypothetical protein|nr:hypothetical protein [Treponema sp.]